jgi:hypothetical protein
MQHRIQLLALGDDGTDAQVLVIDSRVVDIGKSRVWGSKVWSLNIVK